VTVAVTAGNIEGPREETSLLAFFAILLAHRRMIAVCSLIGTIVFGIFALSEATKYESKASFIVRGVSTPVGLPNSATSLGLVLTAFADFAQSVAFYSDLTTANTVLRRVARQSYATSESRGAVRPLPQILGIREKNPVLAVDRAVDSLRASVSTSINARSGVVSVSVAARDPLLAQEISATILHEIEIWSRTRAHAEAVRERQFTEGLAADAKTKLTQAEQRMASFLAINREYNSPDLKMEYDRLQRELGVRQQVFTALATSLEQAKIEEGRDRAAIDIVDVSDRPIEPQRQAAVRKTLIGLATGMLVGMVLAFLTQRATERRLIASRKPV
jgi:uncharacterized protein involved in exopolysaccharide biosynthesis